MSDDSFDEIMEHDALHFAAGDGDVARATQLLAEGRDVHALDDMAWTPLHHAVMKGHVEMIKLLLAHGADVNAHCEEKIGETPLGEVAGT